MIYECLIERQRQFSQISYQNYFYVPSDYKCLFFVGLATYFKFFGDALDFQIQMCQTKSQIKQSSHYNNLFFKCFLLVIIMPKRKKASFE
jgi:hypothetical protein